MSRQKYTADEVVDALKATNGMVYVAARKLGVCAKTLYNYAKKYPKVQESIAEERGHFLDVCETRLMGAVERDESWAIAFALKTLGKDRGYVEKHQIEHEGEVVLKVQYGDDGSQRTDS